VWIDSVEFKESKGAAVAKGLFALAAACLWIWVEN
jgi:hypothetical protein